MMLTTEVLRTRAELQAIRAEWDSLHLRADSASPTSHSAWSLAWLATMGRHPAPDGSLRVILVRREGALVGLLPLYCAAPTMIRRSRVLRFLSASDKDLETVSPDYVDALFADEDAEVRRVICCVLAETKGWDELDMQEVPATSPLGAALRGQFGQSQVLATQSATCFRATIQDGVESFLAGLRSTPRKNGRRLLRQVAQAGLELRVASNDAERESMFADLLRLHADRWSVEGHQGAFARAEFVAFHRSLLAEWGDEGRALLTGLYTPDGVALAVLYGFVHRDEYHFYQCGVDRAASTLVHTPLVAAILETIRHLAVEGVRVFDYLAGDQAYKQEFSDHSTALLRVHVRRTPRGRLPNAQEVRAIVRTYLLEPLRLRPRRARS